MRRYEWNPMTRWRTSSVVMLCIYIWSRVTSLLEPQRLSNVVRECSDSNTFFHWDLGPRKATTNLIIIIGLRLATKRCCLICFTQVCVLVAQRSRSRPPQFAPRARMRSSYTSPRYLLSFIIHKQFIHVFFACVWVVCFVLVYYTRHTRFAARTDFIRRLSL